MNVSNVCLARLVLVVLLHSGAAERFLVRRAEPRVQFDRALAVRGVNDETGS